MPFVLAAGIGVTLYGVCYFLFHDVMFHRRIRFLKLKPWTKYLKRIVNAHATHHQKFYQQQAVAFGFLFASSKYDAA
jgi:beta-carotene 3-hydroxylase